MIRGSNRHCQRKELFDEKHLPAHPLFYINFPGKMNSAYVQENRGAISVICPVPNLDSEINWPRESYHFRNIILSELQENFENDLRADLIGERYFTPVMLQERFNSYYGAAWGFDPNQEHTEVPRLPNRCDDIGNFYLVGNGAHPGPFIPGVLQGAEIVHDEIISLRKN